MTEYRKAVDNIIYLCSCAVNKKSLDLTNVTMDLDSLYKASQKHMLTSMVGQALQSVEVSTRQFKVAIAKAQRKYVLMNEELNRVLSELEDRGIWYMPLKGAVIQNLYPKLAMREMSDYDILIDASHSVDVKAIMEDLGFQVKAFGIGPDDSYVKPPAFNFEMHRSLFGDIHDKRLVKYYADIKERLVKDEDNKYGYHFKPEDFYIYMIAHEYKHYQNGGTGLRSLLDTFVYLRSNNLNMDYVVAECKKIGIADFERLNRSIAETLFNGEALNESQRGMFEYIVNSGTYGTIEHEIDSILRKREQGKLHYLRVRLLGPGKRDPDRNQFERRYACFFNHKILLPILPFYRLFKALMTSPKRIVAEINALRKAGKANKAR